MKKQIGFAGLFLSMFLVPLIFVLTGSLSIITEVLSDDPKGTTVMPKENLMHMLDMHEYGAPPVCGLPTDEQILSKVYKIVGTAAGDSEATFTGTPVTYTNSTGDTEANTSESKEKDVKKTEEFQAIRDKLLEIGAITDDDSEMTVEAAKDEWDL
jgi:hypothetical protein